ncbi:MAG: hypothetical protein R3D29_13785 [Nitratireductor sp.]
MDDRVHGGVFHGGLLIKIVSRSLPVSEILILFGFGGAVVFATLAVSNGERLFSPDVVSPPMLIRVLFEITGRLFYILAISLASSLRRQSSCRQRRSSL